MIAFNLLPRRRRSHLAGAKNIGPAAGAARSRPLSSSNHQLTQQVVQLIFKVVEFELS